MSRWEEEGKIQAIKTPSGQRRYDIESYTGKFVPVITEVASVVVEADNDQVLVIDDLSGGTVVTSLPSHPDPDFNLWGYDAITSVSSGSGTLAAGDYEIAIAWHYPAGNLVFTKITHSVNEGCIQTLDLSFADAVSRSKQFSQVSVQQVLSEVAETLDFDIKGLRKLYEPGEDRLRIQIPKIGLLTVQSSDPTTTTDETQGFTTEEFLVNSQTGALFLSISVAAGEAVWLQISGDGAGSGIEVVADLAGLQALTDIDDDSTYLLTYSRRRSRGILTPHDASFLLLPVPTRVL